MSNAVLALLIVNTVLVLTTLTVVCVAMAVLLDRTKHHAGIPPMIATMIQLMSNPFDGDGHMMHDGPPPIFRSMDGKYTANSLEELISKMQADPNSGLTDADAEDLRNMFNGLTEDMDDDDDLEDWQKGKK